GQDGNEGEVPVLRLPLARQSGQVEVAQAAYAPVEHHRPRDAVMKRVLDQRLDRREARAAGDEYDRLVGVLAQIEHAVRTFEAQDLSALEVVEELGAEVSPRHVADVQLEQRIVFGRSRQRETAPTAVLEQQIDVLAGEILQPLVRRKLERDDRNVLRDLLDLLDTARQLADLDVACAAHFAHFDRERRLRLGDADQR